MMIGNNINRMNECFELLCFDPDLHLESHVRKVALF